jgi:tagaturonate reductase
MKDLNAISVKLSLQHPEKVLQVGGGNFLRAFADWMIDVMNERTDFSGSVILAKPTPGVYPELERQDGLFHVLSRGLRDGAPVDEARLISCISRMVYPYENFHDFLDTATVASLRCIISNTTEAGIAFNVSDRLEDEPPGAFPAKLTHWLYARYQHFQGAPRRGCLILPTELLERNGALLRECVLRYAARWNLPVYFSRWVERHNTFCDTLVDRIVPGYPAARASDIETRLGWRDALLTVAEPYHFWAIEGDQSLSELFPAPQAGLNVRFVDDLTPFRTLKVHILNGAHTAMSAVGYLQGARTVREAMEHPETGPFVRDLIFQEILPALSFPEDEKVAYAKTVLDRFGNPYVEHRLLDICLNSVAKFRARLLPVMLRHVERQGQAPPLIAKALAALILMYRGHWRGAPPAPRDDPGVLSFFAEQWSSSPDAGALAAAILGAGRLWEMDLRVVPGLRERVQRHLEEWEAQNHLI